MSKDNAKYVPGQISSAVDIFTNGIEPQKITDSSKIFLSTNETPDSKVLVELDKETLSLIRQIGGWSSNVPRFNSKLKEVLNDLEDYRRLKENIKLLKQVASKLID